MDENNLDSLLDELSSMDGELNENIDIDSGVDVDADDMDDISLDELDHLDGMDLGDLDFDDIDFDDVDRLIKYIDGQTKFSRFYITKSDVNQDGVIDYNDAVELLAVVNRFKEPEYVTYETRCTPEDYEKYYKNKETSEDATLNNVDINSTEPTQPSESSEPSSETGEETSLESLKFGDINLDGDVTIADAILLNKYLVGSVTLSEASQKNADCDKDGKLTSSDTLVILDYVVGSIDEIK